ncbi:MAG TPA: tetratricopeptide repeat protein, partial [Bacteroidia bacterium]|nr:tetratricopeptide repeat protein [Bacteroidia bacterium]
TEALKNYLASLKIKEAINDQQGIAYCYNNIGLIYDIQGNYPLALKNYFAALKILETINDKQAIATSYNNIGLIYTAADNYPQALKSFFASLKIEEDIDDKEGMAGSYINLGDVYSKQNKIQEAKNCFTKTLQLSLQMGHKELIRDSYSNLTNIDSIMGNYNAAFMHYKLFVLYNDSLNNQETQKRSLQTAMQYEFDKKEMAAKVAQDKLDAIAAQEKQKQQLIIYAVLGLFLVVAVFALLMYNRFRVTNQQKQIISQQKVLVDKAFHELHQKNKEVIDSINYASRIQRALITPEKYIATSLNKLQKK